MDSSVTTGTSTEDKHTDRNDGDGSANYNTEKGIAIFNKGKGIKIDKPRKRKHEAFDAALKEFSETLQTTYDMCNDMVEKFMDYYKKKALKRQAKNTKVGRKEKTVPEVIRETIMQKTADKTFPKSTEISGDETIYSQSSPKKNVATSSHSQISQPRKIKRKTSKPKKNAILTGERKPPQKIPNVSFTTVSKISQTNKITGKFTQKSYWNTRKGTTFQAFSTASAQLSGITHETGGEASKQQTVTKKLIAIQDSDSTSDEEISSLTANIHETPTISEEETESLEEETTSEQPSQLLSDFF